MRFISIRAQAMFLLLIVMILPIVVTGTLSTLYYRDVIARNIEEDNLAHARTISILTTNYVNGAVLFLKSQAARPSVAKALSSGDTAFLNNTFMYIEGAELFDAVFATDDSGTVVASYPYPTLVCRNDTGMPYVAEVLRTRDVYVGDGVISRDTGKPSVYVGAPIVLDNSTVGVLVGALDLPRYSNFVIQTPEEGREFVFLVNSTGHVMVHTNKTYMDTMADFSSLPAVRDVIAGGEGIVEQYFPIEDDDRLAAYAPVPRYGWGIVVAMPVRVAYGPVENATRWFAAATALLILGAALMAAVIGRYLVDPIITLTGATREMPRGDFRKRLPLGRRDEIGDLARAFDRMADEISADQRKIMAARDIAEGEKDRAELYLDVMGHDINNLNQTALLNLELLAAAGGLSDEGRQRLEAAIASIRGSAVIIENVRKIQQATGEHVPTEKLDIDQLIARCVSESPRPGDRKVKIDYRGSPGMYVNASPLLQEAFCNVIDNAIKHSEGDVAIAIDTSRESIGGKVYHVVAISDDGPGIPDDLKPRLFRRLERGKTRAQGRGLGLYIVRTLVERFGGSVRVDDRVPGDHSQGAKFVITLPASDEGNDGTK